MQNIVQDVMFEDPSFPRCGFSTIAEALVTKYPNTFQDKCPAGSRPSLKCSYYSNKLKFRFDEVIRSKKKKNENECPNIPQAYGCVRWRVATLPEPREVLLQKKDEMLDMYNSIPNKEWNWDTINSHLKATFGLQREDINSQVPPKPARKGQKQPTAPKAKTTREIDIDWPFLLTPKGVSVHYQELTQKPDFPSQMTEFENEYEIAKFLKFLKEENNNNKSIYKDYKLAVKTNSIADPHAIAMCLMLTNVMNDKIEQIVIEVEVKYILILLISYGNFLMQLLHSKTAKRITCICFQRTMRLNEVREQIQLPGTPTIISVGKPF